ncbi:MAG TPA: LysR family transcriptional regulator [Polyangiaceae bacterium]|nr:LysR family transcriptional regulator [Polyangiaceae bacterium]
MLHSQLASIDLNLLVVLRALLTERHVSRAATRIGLSQSATSHALARLRELYDDPLLVRSGRTLVPTPRARALLPALERGLADLSVAVAGQPPFDPSTDRRSFTLGMADYIQAVAMAPLLRAVEREAPGIDLVVLSRADLATEVQSGQLDLAVHVDGPLTPGLSSSGVLFEDDFLCMVRNQHPAIGKKVTLEQYLEARHVMVAPAGTSGSFVDSELERRGLSRRVALRVSNFLVAPVVVSQTDYISTMPARLARQLAARYELRLLPPPIEMPRFALSAFWHARMDHDPAHAWLRELLARVCVELGRGNPRGPAKLRK